MSIEVNGVTLPDIPSDVLEQYPYASIQEMATESGESNYVLMATTSEQYLWDFERQGVYLQIVCKGENFGGAFYIWISGEAEWVLEDEASEGVTSLQLFGALVGSNHDIYYADYVDETMTYTDELYFAANFSVSDPNYFAPKSWFDEIARQVMRLTGTSDKLNTDKMLELAKGVEVGGGDLPDAETTTFGDVYSTDVQLSGRYLYNGVSLPALPAGVIDSYQACIIRKNGDTGYYDLFFNAERFYYAAGALQRYSWTSCPWYRIPISTAQDSTAWEYYQDNADTLGIDTNRTLLWANHDIVTDKYTSTTVYFAGSEAIAEGTESVTTTPAEREEYYQITGDTLNAIAKQVQLLSANTNLLTPAEILAALDSMTP